MWSVAGIVAALVAAGGALILVLRIALQLGKMSEKFEALTGSAHKSPCAEIRTCWTRILEVESQREVARETLRADFATFKLELLREIETMLDKRDQRRQCDG